jgi:hypothetical protein
MAVVMAMAGGFGGVASHFLVVPIQPQDDQMLVD